MKLRILLVLPFAFLLASCGPPTSLHPLSDPKSSPVDKALAGEWERFTPVKGDSTPPPGFRFTTREDGLWDMIGQETDGTWDEDEALPAFTTIIRCDRFLTVRIEEQDAVQHFFLKYSLSLDGTLMLAEMAKEPVAKAIDEKRLKGKVGRNKKGEVTAVAITDSMENIRAYIEKEDPKKLFILLGSYRKVEPNK